MTGDSYTIAEKRAEYRSRLARALPALTDALRAMPGVRRISLVGSYARGRADLFTDLDLVVVMDSELPMVERTQGLYERLPITGVDVDILCYTPTEFEDMRERPFLRRALKDERVLHEG